jgi:NADH-quinone oxidoreductase subunit L
MDHHTREHLHESPWTITVPLVLLAIPSLAIGCLTIKPLLFGGFFSDSIHVLAAHDVLHPLGEEFSGPLAFIGQAFLSMPVWLAGAGVLTAYVFFLRRPELADTAERSFQWLYRVLMAKFGFDWFNEHVLVAGARWLGAGLWRYGDEVVIDGTLVDGSARVVGWLGTVMRYAQSGYLYHYAFAMILGLASLLMWVLWRT